MTRTTSVFGGISVLFVICTVMGVMVLRSDVSAEEFAEVAAKLTVDGGLGPAAMPGQGHTVRYELLVEECELRLTKQIDRNPCPEGGVTLVVQSADLRYVRDVSTRRVRDMTMLNLVAASDADAAAPFTDIAARCDGMAFDQRRINGAFLPNPGLTMTFGTIVSDDEMSIFSRYINSVLQECRR